MESVSIRKLDDQDVSLTAELKVEVVTVWYAFETGVERWLEELVSKQALEGRHLSVAIPVSKSTLRPLAPSVPKLRLPFEPVSTSLAVTCMRSIIQASAASGLRISSTGSSWKSVCSGVYRWSF